MSSDLLLSKNRLFSFKMQIVSPFIIYIKES